MNTLTTCIRKLWLPLMVVAIFALAAVSPTTMSAQDDEVTLEECSGGTLYYIAFPDTTTNTFDDRHPNTVTPRFYFFVYSPVDGNKVRYGRAKGAGQTVTVDEGKFERIDVTQSTPIVTRINEPSNNVYKIESDYPVVVYAYMSTPFGTAAFTPIPVEAWGTEHFAAAFPGEVVNNLSPGGEFNYNKDPKEGPAEILIIAAYDGTVVNITPNGLLKNCFGCETNIKLSAGEAYQVQTIVDTDPNNVGIPQPDLAGSYISSNKRIGVVSGCSRSQLNPNQTTSIGGNIFKDALIEWIPPREQHGQEFVYLPTWDDRRPTGAPNANLAELRTGELVRIYGTTGALNSDETRVTYSSATGASRIPTTTDPIKTSKFSEDLIGVPIAHQYKASKPAMAMMAPLAVVKEHEPTLYWGSFYGAFFDAWATFMVELAPREQWTSFVPVTGTGHPAGMSHYLNLVTDTNSMDKIYYRNQGGNESRVFFTRRIPGTDLIWTSRELGETEELVIFGKEGARFNGHVYGLWKGFEEYIPGGTKRDDDDDKKRSVASGGKDDPVILHPSDYIEAASQAYGYPFAPSRCVLGPPDEYKIDTVMDCTTLNIKIQAINNNPVGIRSLGIERGTGINAKLDFVLPQNPLDLKSEKVIKAEVNVVPINPLQDAEAVIIIRDRTRNSKTWRIYYKYEAERVDLSPIDGISFGGVTLDTDSPIETITITNPLERDVVVEELKLAYGTQEFEIVEARPDVPHTLGPGESMEVDVRIHPTIENKIYEDSVIVQLGCTRVTLPLYAETVKPCIRVDDLNFGTLGVGQVDSLDLTLCNEGEGIVTFDNDDDPVLTWLNENFTVSDEDIQSIKDAVLGPDDCITIEVFFSSDETGNFRTVARYWASTRDCRDTSVWTARVTQPGPQITDYDWGPRWLTTNNECTKNDTSEYIGEIYLSNDGDEPFRIEAITLTGANPENFRLDTEPTRSIKPGDEIRPGDGFTRTIGVFFFPDEERIYEAEVKVDYRILSTNATGSISGFIRGEGIQSYISITDYSFGAIKYTGPPQASLSGTVTLTASGSRDVTITDLFISGPFATTFVPAPTDPGYPTGNTPTATAPWILSPGTSVVIPVTYTPNAELPAIMNGFINVVGDFTYSTEACGSDSLGALDGSPFTLAADADGFDFGVVLTCFDKDGFITVRNQGTQSVTVTSVSQSSNPAFSVDPDFTINYPYELGPVGSGDDILEIPVVFAPTNEGNYNGTVDIVIMNLEGTDIVAQPQVELIGVGDVFEVRAHINRDYSQYPGLTLDIPVTLDDPLDDAEVSDLTVTIVYDDGMMLLEDITLGDLLEGKGWFLEETTKQAGIITVRLTNTSGGTLDGVGDILMMHYITYIGDAMESEMPLTVQLAGAPCATVIPQDGFAKLDSVCGLNFRLIEAFGTKYALEQPSPNPFNPTTDIQFSLGLDGQTKVEIYNAVGEKVAVLVDEYLQPGSYAVTWDATSFPSGLYYYKLTSGHWSQTNTMLLRK